jgi:hypothetical protein
VLPTWAIVAICVPVGFVILAVLAAIAVPVSSTCATKVGRGGDDRVEAGPQISGMSASNECHLPGPAPKCVLERARLHLPSDPPVSPSTPDAAATTSSMPFRQGQLAVQRRRPR